MTIRAFRTNDAELVSYVLTHPSIHEFASQCASVEETAETISHIVNSPEMYFIVITDDGKLCGVMIFEARSLVTVEGHVNFLPGFRGKKGYEYLAAGLDWIFSMTTCQCVVGYIPKFNRACYLFVKKFGFNLIGVIPKSYLKGDSLVDQYLLSMSREGFYGRRC